MHVYFFTRRIKQNHADQNLPDTKRHVHPSFKNSTKAWWPSRVRSPRATSRKYHSGRAENFMYAHVLEHFPRLCAVPPFFTFLRSGGHKKPLTDIIHSKLVYHVPTCSVSSSRQQAAAGTKTKKRNGPRHVARRHVTWVITCTSVHVHAWLYTGLPKC